MLDNDLLKRILQAALAEGGDYADVYFEHRRPLSLLLDDGRIEKALSGLDRGVGIRLIEGQRTAYAYTNDLSVAALLEAASTLARSVRDKRIHKVLDLRKLRPGTDFTIKTPPDSIDTSRKISMMKRAEALARGMSDKVRQVTVIYRDALQLVQIANSEGVIAEDERVHTVGIVQVVAQDGETVQTGYEPVGGAAGFEIFESMPLEEVARIAADRALRMLKARRAPGGRMPVVIASTSGGTMIHEAIGHGLEADLAGQGLSKYSGKMGVQIASSLVTVIDDGTIPGKRGSFRFDDEGTPSGRTVLVQDGVLVNYMYDRLSAGKMGAKLTGNGRRESYQSRPIPRMTNTFIAPGASDPANVLSNTPKGLFVTKMGGGQVNTVTGDFVFEVSEGYLIENGQKGELVRGATLTGNGPETLLSIDLVGTDLGFSIGTCGKDAQGVPVSDAMPTVRIPEMVVGGEV